MTDNFCPEFMPFSLKTAIPYIMTENEKQICFAGEKGALCITVTGEENEP